MAIILATNKAQVTFAGTGSETPLFMRWKAAAEHSILTDRSYLRLAISLLQVGTNAQKQLFSAIIHRTI